MTNNYDELIGAFETRLRNLISKYQSLQEQNTRLQEQLERKQTDLMHAHTEILELRKNYDHLLTVKSWGTTQDDIAHSKKRIAKMVREIDKCIALLDE